MNAMQKVLVVDNGERASDFALSAELAELGYASVTAPFEAADDVLALIQTPAAVVLQLPKQASWAERKQFLELAERLRVSLKTRNVPVIIVNGMDASGAHALLLQSELGARILSEPEL